MRRTVGKLILFALLGGVSAVLLLGAALSRARPIAVIQPLTMNHKRHAEAKMDCVACHQNAESQAIASLPLVDDCMSCHKDPQGKDPTEPRVREYAQRGEEIPWIRVNRLPGHVYFSHAAHVTLGKMECKTCHGDMTQVSESLTAPNVHLDMVACMSCHTEKRASNQCVACHK